MTETSQDTYQEVTKKATRSMGWNYLSFGLSKGFNLLTVSILAHLLAPEYFGLVALATLTMDYLSVINDMGLGAALIQRREDIEKSSNIAFTLNVSAGAILTTLIFIIAPYAASYFREPQLTAVLRWMGLTFIIASLGSVHNVRLQRELNFRKKMIPDVGNTIIKAIVSIPLALAGFGVWALVAGQLIGTATTAVLMWVVMPWRPKFAWDPQVGKSLFKYGLSIMGNNALSVWEDSFGYLIIGLFYSPASLGIYTLAYRLPQTLVLNVLWIMTAVLFPTFSSLQDHKERLKQSYLSILRFVQLLVTPVCLGMIIAADPLIRVAFGDQWLDAIPILRALSIYVWIVSIGFHIGDVYKAIGRPDILIKTSLPVFFIHLGLVWVGAQYSLAGVAYAHITSSALTFIIRYFVTARILKITIGQMLRELPSFICGIGLTALALPTLYLTANTTPLIQLIAVTIAGAIGYVGCVWLIERRSIIRAFQLLGIKLPIPLNNESGNA